MVLDELTSSTLGRHHSHGLYNLWITILASYYNYFIKCQINYTGPGDTSQDWPQRKGTVRELVYEVSQ